MFYIFQKLRFVSASILFIFSFSCLSFAAYSPPGGHNNDIQYKNGLSYAGSDNFIFNGTNVGVGSSVPGQALDVQGTVRATGFVGNGSLLTNLPSSSQWTTTNTNDVYLPSSGNVGIGTTLTNSGAALTVMNGNVGIGTWVPGGALIVQSGNVGIGSVVPGQMLDVQGTVRDVGEIVGAAGITLGGVTNTSWPAAGSNYWLNNGGSNVGINTTLAVGIGTTFVGGTGEAVLSIMNGNVGIGTWAPTAALQVGSGTGSFSATTGGTIQGSTLRTGSSGSILNVYGGSTNQGGEIDYVGGSASTNPAGTLLFKSGTATGSQAERMRLDPNGNVGIGTVTPLSLLTVNGGVGIGTSATNASYITNYAAPAGGMIVQGNVGIGTFNPFGGGLIVLPANTGNVGIGSLAPGTALDVTGTIRDTGQITNGNIGIGTTFIGGAGEGAMSVMNGNVGIGTWTPGSALQVNNTITFASEYSVTWASTTTINWNNGNKQTLTLGGASTTINFTAPVSGVANLLLKLVQPSSAGPDTVTWGTAAVKWPSATAPTLTTTNSQADIITCYYNGTDYFCSATLNFTP